MDIVSFADRLTRNLCHGFCENSVAAEVHTPLRKALSRIRAAVSLTDLYFPKKERVIEISEGSALRYGLWLFHGYLLSFELVDGNVANLRFEDRR
jgi:plasmid maintenance system killer protein